MNKKSRYVHETRVHNLKAPTIIVEEILKHFYPKKFIDLGCGLGTFVKVFQDHGVDAYGVNGEWVEKEKLFIDEDKLIIHNLEEYRDFGKKYDMAMSLEVAEHIDGKYADNFVKTITSCADIIVFSAAFPGQGGQNHINEQRPEYWEEKFKKQGYKFYDVFRAKFWDDEDIFYWYRQNMFLVMKEGIELPSTLEDKGPRYVIHPEVLRLHDFRNMTIFGGLRYFGGALFYKIFPFLNRHK